ncbi:hypothetical protein BDDG_12903 [Blastomyces dermatitidis ATCC 18188]|uniref:Uncharacterized protein n=1 Tax=Ajellomyces dermatitidis (strain ATCC 18188 / CBS 674.68) TaxID=653446 RepID=A0A0J9ERD0_AJEDA|nr:hypothetical protein BDDG_12903 [Blastomyces dermatitidis ATCC 18188]
MAMKVEKPLKLTAVIILEWKFGHRHGGRRKMRRRSLRSSSSDNKENLNVERACSGSQTRKIIAIKKQPRQQ